VKEAMLRSIGLLFVSLVLVAPVPTLAGDAVWPTKAIRIIAPGDAGGVLDIRARWLAERLTPLLGQTVLVENKPGAGGAIGTEAGARSLPDGHTLTLIHLGTMAANPHLYSRLGYDPLLDFVPITQVSVGPLVLAVNSTLPVASTADLLRMAREQPGRLNFASAGIGTPGHLASELFKRAAGVDVAHIPYNGGGQAVAGLLGGQVTFMIENPSVLLPHIKSGRLRALAVTGTARLKSLPDVPTAREAGLAGFEFVAWTGLAAPAGTPKPVIDRLYREIRDLMATSEARDWLDLIGSYQRTDSPEAFAAGIRSDHARLGKVIHDAGIRLE
jgi:tripartite-type tricarboxylate transporter receptor subunit TctC